MYVCVCVLQRLKELRQALDKVTPREPSSVAEDTDRGQEPPAATNGSGPSTTHSDPQTSPPNPQSDSEPSEYVRLNPPADSEPLIEFPPDPQLHPDPSTHSAADSWPVSKLPAETNPEPSTDPSSDKTEDTRTLGCPLPPPSPHLPPLSPATLSQLSRCLKPAPDVKLSWQPLRGVTRCSCGRAFTFLVTKVQSADVHLQPCPRELVVHMYIHVYKDNMLSPKLSSNQTSMYIQVLNQYSIYVELAPCIEFVHCATTWVYAMCPRLEPRFLVQYFTLSFYIQGC